MQGSLHQSHEQWVGNWELLATLLETSLPNRIDPPKNATAFGVWIFCIISLPCRIRNRPIGQMGSIRGVVIHVKDLWSAPRGGFGSEDEGIGWNSTSFGDGYYNVIIYYLVISWGDQVLMSILSLDVDCDFLPVAFYFLLCQAVDFFTAPEDCALLRCKVPWRMHRSSRLCYLSESESGRTFHVGST